MRALLITLQKRIIRSNSREERFRALAPVHVHFALVAAQMLRFTDYPPRADVSATPILNKAFKFKQVDGKTSSTNLMTCDKCLALVPTLPVNTSLRHAGSANAFAEGVMERRLANCASNAVQSVCTTCRDGEARQT